MIRLVDVERDCQAGPSRSYVLRRINLEIREGECRDVRPERNEA